MASDTGYAASATPSVSYVLLHAFIRGTLATLEYTKSGAHRNQQRSEPLTPALEIAHLLEKRHNAERLGYAHRPPNGSGNTRRFQYLLGRCPCLERPHCLLKHAVRAATTQRHT